MKRGGSRPGLRITIILVSMVVGVVTIILFCCILLFLSRYRSAIVQNARTSSAQAVSQVSNTVSNYLQDMDQAMELVEQSMTESAESRDELLAAFFKFRPDVVAVTSYSARRYPAELLVARPPAPGADLSKSFLQSGQGSSIPPVLT